MPFAIQPQVDKLVREMLTQGVIQPSSSPWASPVAEEGRYYAILFRLSSAEQCHQTRWSLHYRGLMIHWMFWQEQSTSLPLTRRQGSGWLLWSLHNERRLHSSPILDSTRHALRSGECNSDLSETDGARVRWSHPQLLSGVPDDVSVMGSTLEEHNANLMKVLERIRDVGLPKKCTFTLESVVYLGHVVTAKGIQTDQQKLEAVRAYPVPTDVKSLQ